MNEAGRGRADADGFDALADGLAARFALGIAAPMADAELDGWAARVFRWQFEHNRALRGYWEARGATPGAVRGWRDVPPVPTAAFKHLSLLSVEEGRVPEARFLTSGTTRGAERRGEHPVASLALYRAALLPAFRAHLLPDGARLPVLALLPSPSDAPHSSLSHMVGTVMDELAADGSVWLADADGGLRADALLAALRAAEAEGPAVLLAATAFGLVHALDLLARDGVRVRLPDGSRLMETGGFKGRARSVERAELYGGVLDRLGIPPARIVNEYGMTELLSQLYEPVLSRGVPADGALEGRFHVGPPWLRTRVLDPVTLAPVPAGRPGLLCHFDLANLGSVACVLTEDQGIEVEDGVRLLGRTPGAEPRGCSLVLEELLAVAEGA